MQRVTLPTDYDVLDFSACGDVRAIVANIRAETVRHINLSNNRQLEDYSFLRQFTGLERLQLANCAISSDQLAERMQNVPHSIVFLSLRGNLLISFVGLPSLPQLQELDISQNDFEFCTEQRISAVFPRLRHICFSAEPDDPAHKNPIQVPFNSITKINSFVLFQRLFLERYYSSADIAQGGVQQIVGGVLFKVAAERQHGILTIALSRADDQEKVPNKDVTIASFLLLLQAQIKQTMFRSTNVRTIVEQGALRVKIADAQREITGLGPFEKQQAAHGTNYQILTIEHNQQVGVFVYDLFNGLFLDLRDMFQVVQKQIEAIYFQRVITLQCERRRGSGRKNTPVREDLDVQCETPDKRLFTLNKDQYSLNDTLQVVPASNLIIVQSQIFLTRQKMGQIITKLQREHSIRVSQLAVDAAEVVFLHGEYYGDLTIAADDGLRRVMAPLWHIWSRDTNNHIIQLKLDRYEYHMRYVLVNITYREDIVGPAHSICLAPRGPVRHTPQILRCNISLAGQQVVCSVLELFNGAIVKSAALDGVAFNFYINGRLVQRGHKHTLRLTVDQVRQSQIVRCIVTYQHQQCADEMVVQVVEGSAHEPQAIFDEVLRTWPGQDKRDAPGEDIDLAKSQQLVAQAQQQLINNPCNIDSYKSLIQNQQNIINKLQLQLSTMDKAQPSNTTAVTRSIWEHRVTQHRKMLSAKSQLKIDEHQAKVGALDRLLDVSRQVDRLVDYHVLTYSHTIGKTYVVRLRVNLESHCYPLFEPLVLLNDVVYDKFLPSQAKIRVQRDPGAGAEYELRIQFHRSDAGKMFYILIVVGQDCNRLIQLTYQAVRAAEDEPPSPSADNVQINVGLIDIEQRELRQIPLEFAQIDGSAYLKMQDVRLRLDKDVEIFRLNEDVISLQDYTSTALKLSYPYSYTTMYMNALNSAVVSNFSSLFDFPSQRLSSLGILLINGILVMTQRHNEASGWQKQLKRVIDGELSSLIAVQYMNYCYLCLCDECDSLLEEFYRRRGLLFDESYIDEAAQQTLGASSAFGGDAAAMTPVKYGQMQKIWEHQYQLLDAMDVPLGLSGQGEGLVTNCNYKMQTAAERSVLVCYEPNGRVTHISRVIPPRQTVPLQVPTQLAGSKIMVVSEHVVVNIMPGEGFVLLGSVEYEDQLYASKEIDMELQVYDSHTGRFVAGSALSSAAQDLRIVADGVEFQFSCSQADLNAYAHGDSLYCLLSGGASGHRLLVRCKSVDQILRLRFWSAGGCGFYRDFE